MSIDKKKCFLPALSAIGVLIGILFAVFTTEEGSASVFGGYLHPFPADFTISWLYKALLAEFLPVAVIYLGGFGYLHRFLSGLSVIYRTILSGFTLALLYRQISGEVALYLYIFICLADLATIGIYLSLSRLSALFFRSISVEFQRKKVRRYTADVLFFVGLSLLFYFIRGCIMAVFFHTV